MSECDCIGSAYTFDTRQSELVFNSLCSSWIYFWNIVFYSSLEKSNQVNTTIYLLRVSMEHLAGEIFPGLQDLLSIERFTRVEKILYSFFKRNLNKKPNGLPFISTGDIPAMWLRDSTWQVRPLLKSKNPFVIQLLSDLSKSQTEYFLIDPYANAFNQEANNNCWEKDFDDQSPWVFERKYELDSWASILFLARKVKEIYGQTDHLDSNFEKAFSKMIELAKIEQNHNPESYIFLRKNEIPHDSLDNNGRGNPVARTGMVFSAFRPSDDACKYGYLIPANLFFMNELKELSHYMNNQDAAALAAEIEDGINEFGVIDGKFAYEVDGFGNHLLIDDANVPSLLSLPYLDIMSNQDLLYKQTREFVLSSKNPYFFSGKRSKGIGSQHTPIKHVWPIAIAISALTSANKVEQAAAIEHLERRDANTGSMHESFHVDDENIFTRDWFSWSDMTYLDLVLESVNYECSIGCKSRQN